MRYLLTLLAMLFLFSSPTLALTSTFQTDGWNITATYTSPAPLVGGGPTVDATITYMVDGVLQTTTSSEIIALPYPVIITTKIWTSKAVLNTSYTVNSIAGEGTVIFDATGHLVFKVNAPNDGKPHTLTFHLKSTLPGWIVKTPWLRYFFMKTPTFVG